MRVLVGVTGSIAAYKAAELVRLFVRNGDDVHVVMTPAATGPRMAEVPLSVW